MRATKCGDVIVFIPGILGSVLERDGKALWDTRLATLTRLVVSRARDINSMTLADDSPDAEALDDGVVATSVIPELHLLPGLWKIDGYTRVLRELQRRLDLEPGANLFAFPYDWRRDNRSAARRLRRQAMDWLHRWRRDSGNADARLVIVAHSMGGLVARYFLEVLGGWQDTRALVTLGTPYRGAVEPLMCLANGFDVKFGPVRLDLSAFCRSCTSVYQLMPIWECFDPGDGTLVRPGERGGGIPNVDPRRALDALRFHREIQDAVDTNRRDPRWEERGYAIHPIVGTHQRTAASATLRDGKLVDSHEIRGRTIDGDGSVSRVSAVPIELSRAGRELFVATPHASLQSADAVLHHIEGLMTARQLDLAEFFAGGPGLGLGVEPLHLSDEPIVVRVDAADAPGSLDLVVEDVDGGAAVVARTLADEDRDVVVGPLPAGSYRVRIAGAGVPAISDVFTVLDPVAAA